MQATKLSLPSGKTFDAKRLCAPRRWRPVLLIQWSCTAGPRAPDPCSGFKGFESKLSGAQEWRVTLCLSVSVQVRFLTSGLSSVHAPSVNLVTAGTLPEALSNEPRFSRPGDACEVEHKQHPRSWSTHREDSLGFQAVQSDAQPTTSDFVSAACSMTASGSWPLLVPGAPNDMRGCPSKAAQRLCTQAVDGFSERCTQLVIVTVCGLPCDYMVAKACLNMLLLCIFCFF